MGCYVEAFAKFAKVRCTQNTAGNIRLVDVVATLNVLYASFYRYLNTVVLFTRLA